jgi:hypothetical protein
LAGRRLALTIIVLAGLPLMAAHAADAFRVANSGEDLRVRRYFSWKADCSFNPTTVEITSGPSHGKLTQKMGRYVLTAANVRGGSAGICAGKTIDVVELHYTADPCFAGRDTFAVRVSAPDEPVLRDTYQISVRKRRGSGAAPDCPVQS